MPDVATEIPPQEEEKEAMPTMGFLDHLEELRKRIIYSIISVAVGFFACWIPRADLRHHAEADHECSEGERDGGKARVLEPDRTLQSLLEGFRARRALPYLALCVVPG